MYVCIGRWFHPVRLRPISGVVGGNIFPPYGCGALYIAAIMSGVMFSRSAMTSCTVASRSKALLMQLVE